MINRCNIDLEIDYYSMFSILSFCLSCPYISISFADFGHSISFELPRAWQVILTSKGQAMFYIIARCTLSWKTECYQLGGEYFWL